MNPVAIISDNKVYEFRLSAYKALTWWQRLFRRVPSPPQTSSAGQFSSQHEAMVGVKDKVPLTLAEEHARAKQAHAESCARMVIQCSLMDARLGSSHSNYQGVPSSCNEALEKLKAYGLDISLNRYWHNFTTILNQHNLEVLERLEKILLKGDSE